MSEAVERVPEKWRVLRWTFTQVAELIPESTLERSRTKVACQAFAHISGKGRRLVGSGRHHLRNAYTIWKHVRADAKLSRPDRTVVAQRQPNWQGRKCIHVYGNSAWGPGNNDYQLSHDPAASGHGHRWRARLPAGSGQYERDYGRLAVGAGTLAGSDGSRQPSENELVIARFQGKHVTEIAKKLAGK
jgi:hypothetical protein